ncbi:MAG: nitroreductase family protein [Methanosarcinaceae archaeon]|nr:nitroreductase family protein [Methanosarcinaceae archaeon]
MFISLIEKRRSIRRFARREVESEKIDMLLEAALRSPSSRGFNPWHFVVVIDRSLLEKLSRAKQHGASFLRTAPLGIVICGDPDKSDVWVEDCSIASIFIHLAATSLDLGSCWIQIRERMHDGTKTAEGYVRDILDIPGNLRIESMVAVGYPDETKPPHKKESLQYEKVHHDSFGRPYHCSAD